MASQDLIPVPFRNATLFLADVDGTPYTPMKPIVEGMGLSWQGQHEKFSENKARWGIRVILIPTDGGKQEAICLPLRKLPGWLMTIQPTRVKPEIRDTVIAYQNECDDALWDYWSKGRAINPRAMTLGEQCLASAQAIVAMEREQARQATALSRLEHRIDMMDGDTGYMTVTAYIRNLGRRIPLSKAQSFGQKASKAAKALGVMLGNVPDERFGTVHSYPIALLHEVADEFFASEEEAA